MTFSSYIAPFNFISTGQLQRHLNSGMCWYPTPTCARVPLDHVATVGAPCYRRFSNSYYKFVNATVGRAHGSVGGGFGTFYLSHPFDSQRPASWEAPGLSCRSVLHFSSVLGNPSAGG